MIESLGCVSRKGKCGTLQCLRGCYECKKIHARSTYHYPLSCTWFNFYSTMIIISFGGLFKAYLFQLQGLLYIILIIQQVEQNWGLYIYLCNII